MTTFGGLSTTMRASEINSETVAFLAFANFGVVYYDFSGHARTKIS